MVAKAICDRGERHNVATYKWNTKNMHAMKIYKLSDSKINVSFYTILRKYLLYCSPARRTHTVSMAHIHSIQALYN